MDYTKLSADELIKLLSHANKWHRQTALRVLWDRGDKTLLPRLKEAVWSGEVISKKVISAKSEGTRPSVAPLNFHFWPLFGRSWSPVSTELSTIWPLFRYEDRKAGGYDLNLLWPLFEINRDEKYSKTRFFPLYSHESNVDGSYETNIGILFNNSRSAEGQRESRLFPFYSATGKPDGSYEGNAGYILADWDGDGKGKGTFHILWRLVQNDDIQVEEEDALHGMRTVSGRSGGDTLRGKAQRQDFPRVVGPR